MSKQPRVLYCDPISPPGHRTLNRLFVETLVGAGLQVDIAWRDGYLAASEVPDGCHVIPIPKSLFAKGSGKLAARIEQWRVLRFVRSSTERGAYDATLFSSFDEISFALSGIGGRLFLVVHGNAADLENPIKRFFLRWVGRRATFVVFHEFIKRRCENFGLPRVVVEPLGLSDPYVMSREARGDALATVDRRLCGPRLRHIFFAPAGAKYADAFMATVTADAEFQGFLRENGIALVVKDRSLQLDCPNVVILRRSLSDEQYRSLFISSCAIILSYPNSFNYRVSAVLFECFSNEKRILLSDIDGFHAFDANYAYDAFFRTKEDLMSRMKEAIEASQVGAHNFKEINSLRPTFADVRAAVVPRLDRAAASA